jgi:CubicO group peptidase (beta-lactamase class C family)
MRYWWVLDSISRMNKYILFLVGICLVSCDEMLLKDEAGITLEEKLSPPEALNDGWSVSSPAAEQVDAVAIESLIRDLQKSSRNIHGVLIAKNGKLIVEAYFDGWHAKRLQSMRSASKSVASTLVGIAIDKGYITDVNQSVFDFFPEYADLNTPQKEKIQLQHVLTMTAGLRWDQERFPDDDPRNDEDQLSKSQDGFRYLLEKSVVIEPGAVFEYNSGCSDLLMGIVDHATGMDAARFSEEYLFKPLGIQNYGWRTNLNGYPNGAFGLHLYPRDMLKIGQLFLDSGIWKDQRIVSAAWIKQATKEYIEVWEDIGYGYQWWIHETQVGDKLIRRYHAQGHGGQVICVVPELNAVVVLTGTNYNVGHQIPYNLLQTRILPALLPD